MLSTARPLGLIRFRLHPSRNRRPMNSEVDAAVAARGRRRSHDGGDSIGISLSEWQGWGTSSLVPSLVAEVIGDLKMLELEMDTRMSFAGIGGKFQGDFKVKEDRKHRETYQVLADSEKKLQFFAARQIACRLLGSRGYLCQKCWLAQEDCMCARLVPCSLWRGIHFWLYMHPKDFLRQNNTGKLLWQVFGIQAASLCLFGIQEHEEIMWDALKSAGRDMVWCLYPNKTASPKSVEDLFSHRSLTTIEGQPTALDGDRPLNFILIDGTWSNSSAMFKRLKEHWRLIWGDENLPCISLSMPGVSVMHKLRPQPAWDHTCTAAAAVGLLSELHLLPAFSSYGLDKQAEAVESGLGVLLDALTTRRLRMGRSITRRQRTNLV